MFTPFDYQYDAIKAAIAHAKKSLDSQDIIMPTGSGKSVAIANIAAELIKLSGKKVLVTAPSKKLVIQNHAKYVSYGYEASIFCAGAGKKSLKHDVVFGSPLSVRNALNRIVNDQYGAIIMDECDLVTRTIKEIIYELQRFNPKLRIIGLTATPYRMGTGYIHAAHYQDGFVEETIDPFFKLCTYECHAIDLMERDPPRLTRPILGKQALKYDTAGLIMKRTGKWEASTIDAAFVGKGRLTSEICADIIESTRNYNGVMIYASTIKHAEEVMASLPPALSGIVHSKNKESDRIIERFERQEIKYIVNVDCLTVGVDFPHADVIAMLRRTESARLYQQIIGRVLRLHPDKQHALILDYADNNSAHFPDGNVFNPKIKAKKPGESERIDVDCPDCRFTNSFALRPNDAGFVVNNEGNWTWPDSGTEVLNDEKQPIPGHLGRRCFGILRNNTRCTYRFAFKECPDCNHENDIAARYCEKCKHELVDPNAKLSIESGKQGSFLIEPVMTIELGERIAKTGTKLKEVTITTALRKKIKLFLRMAIESDREKFRLCRDFADKECSVEFKPDGKYYSFVNLSAGMPWQ